MLDGDSSFYLISFNILITCVECMDIVGRSFILLTFSLLVVKGLTILKVDFASQNSIE